MSPPLSDATQTGEFMRITTLKKAWRENPSAIIDKAAQDCNTSQVGLCRILGLGVNRLSLIRCGTHSTPHFALPIALLHVKHRDNPQPTIHDFLAERGMTQRELAEIIGCTTVTISNWVTGAPPKYLGLTLAEIDKQMGERK